MPGPFNPRCNCRCAIPFPDCFGCEVIELAEVPENVTLVAADFAWTFPETDVSSESWRNFNSYSCDTEFRTRTRPLSNINGMKQMRAKPDGACYWLWNDVRAVSTVYRHGTARFIDETIYEPLNAVDPTSPWDRVLLPNTDPRCGYASPICIVGFDATTSITLYPIEIFEPNTIHLTAGWYWRLQVISKIARSAIAGATYAFNSALPLGAYANLLQVTPVNYAMATPYGLIPFDYTSTASSSPPYRYEGGVTFPLGGLMEEYMAPIDCDLDFLGNPITLTKNTYAASQSADFDATTPSTVTVTL